MSKQPALHLAKTADSMTRTFFTAVSGDGFTVVGPVAKVVASETTVKSTSSPLATDAKFRRPMGQVSIANLGTRGKVLINDKPVDSSLLKRVKTIKVVAVDEKGKESELYLSDPNVTGLRLQIQAETIGSISTMAGIVRVSQAKVVNGNITSESGDVEVNAETITGNVSSQTGNVVVAGDVTGTITSVRGQAIIQQSIDDDSSEDEEEEEEPGMFGLDND